MVLLFCEYLYLTVGDSFAHTLFFFAGEVPMQDFLSVGKVK